MPDPSTTRLALYKSKSDGSELVNYSQDIGQNWDRVDAAVGFQAVTASTRPSTPFSGKPIFQTDTSYSTYFSNGTSPASGSWVEIPNSSSTFGGNLKLAAGQQVNIGGSTSAAPLSVMSTTSSANVISSRMTGDVSNSRWYVNADGQTNWGAGGGSSADTNLYRSAANVLTTDDSLTVGINLSVAGSGSVTGNLAVTGGLSVGATTWTPYTPAVANVGTATWTTRTGYYYKIGKLVFVCVYLVVNAAGSGSSLVTVDMPSSVDRSTRQALTLHAETVGVNGNGSTTGGTIRGGECVFFTGGTGATADRLRVDDSDGDGENNIQGVDLKAGANITIQGWYREA